MLRRWRSRRLDSREPEPEASPPEFGALHYQQALKFKDFLSTLLTGKSPSIRWTLAAWASWFVVGSNPVGKKHVGNIILYDLKARPASLLLTTNQPTLAANAYKRLAYVHTIILSTSIISCFLFVFSCSAKNPKPNSSAKVSVSAQNEDEDSAFR